MHSSYKDHIINFLEKEDIRSDLKDIFKPFLKTIYNEMFVYILIICIYNIFLFIIILAIFYILYNHILNKKPTDII